MWERGKANFDKIFARCARRQISNQILKDLHLRTRTAGEPINNNEIQPSVFLREMNFHFMALLGEKTMQGQFHKPAERLGAIATSRAKVAERLKPLKALCD